MKKNLNRHQAREVALQILYQADINKEGLEKNLKILKEERPELKLQDTFLSDIIEGTYQKLTEIDKFINQNAIDWKIDRMDKVDRNIIRLAIYEILFKPDIPVAVSINEAIELAKSFNDQQSAKFVNGVLGRLVKNLEEE